MSEINLNTADFLTPVELFEKLVSEIPEELIYYKYLGSTFKVGGVTYSPFRPDKNPSFGVFRTEEGLIYNDFGSPDSGDVYEFLVNYYKQILGYTSITSMISKFKSDFSDINNFETSTENIGYLTKYSEGLNFLKKQSEFELEVRITNFNKCHLNYWSNFGISEKTLRLFNVFPISHYFINKRGFIADPLAFAYIETKDDKLTIKIYQPFNKKFKWISNTNFSVHQGYRILPETGPLLIITKSLKDVMAIKEATDIPAIGIQGEKSRIKVTVRAEYSSRFKYILCLFDNDKEGKNLSEFFKTYYSIDYILIPDEYHSKDFSDLVKKKGKDTAQEILLELINKKTIINA